MRVHVFLCAVFRSDSDVHRVGAVQTRSAAESDGGRWHCAVGGVVRHRYWLRTATGQSSLHADIARAKYDNTLCPCDRVISYFMTNGNDFYMGGVNIFFVSELNTHPFNTHPFNGPFPGLPR